MRKILLLMLGTLLLSMQLLAQTRTISGRITDAQGNGIPNVSVIANGTKAGTTTGPNGDYTLNVPISSKSIIVTSVGYERQEMAIGAGNSVSLSLTAQNQILENVVVTVPYGTVKKTSFTGSESTVTARTLQRQQVTSVTRALEGQIAGVIATNGGGAPGTGASILIRGIGSVSSTSSPLFVVNGIPYDGSISAIPNDDVESITVLKDAAAAALYGSRAANGVVMITTKKGRKGRSVISAVFRQGYLSRGIPEYDRVEEKDYYELFWEAYRNREQYGTAPVSATQAGITASSILTGPNGLVYNAYNVPGAQLVDPVTGKLNPNAKLLWHESWEDALFHTASRTNANFSVSGGEGKMNYYLSSGYLNEEGILKNSGYKRYNFRINLDVSATDWLTTGLNLDGAMARRNDVISGGTATSNPFYYSRNMGPIYPVYQHDVTTGAYVDSAGQHKLDYGVPEQMGTRPYAGRSNLLGTVFLDDRHVDIFNGNANAYAEIKFLKDFSFKTTLGVNYFTNNSTTYQNNQYGDAAPTNAPLNTNGGRSTKSSDRQISLTGNEVLTWNKALTSDHNVRVLTGHENYRYQYNYLSANASGFLFPGQTELDNGTASFSPASSYENNHRIESYFGNVNYDFKQRYFVSASYRTDGSSRFNEESRWGNFYSAGLSWRLSQEKFISTINWINELKLRASYGEQGNENIGLFYPYRSYYYANANGTYSAPTRPVNEDLQWETNKTTNVGLDFAIFKGRLQGSFEWFNRQSDNLLFDVPLPISTGYGSVYQNVGTMKNYGVEMQLTYNAVRGKNFGWRIDLNATHFTNKITKLPPNQEANGIVSGTKKLLVGHSIYDFWLRDYAGVDAATGDALYYMDIMGADNKPTGQKTVTNVYNSATLYYRGSAIPKVTGGLTNTFTYQGFELSILTSYGYGGLFYDGNYGNLMHRGSAGIAWSTDILQRWQKPGDVTTVPRLQQGIAGQDGTSTRFLFDASYVNIKNVTVSYNLSASVAKRLHLNNVQIFGNVDNAYLFTAKKGMDPQRSFNGTSDATYVPYRTITFGFNVNL